ncbi:MAG: glycosyltransferase family 9 protein [Planctomycetaceae bacterium]
MDALPSITVGRRERILVVGNPYLGDTVLALPLLRGLRGAFPGHVIDLLAEGGAVGRLLAGCPHVDEVLRWERPPRVPVAGGSRRRLRTALASLEATAGMLRDRRYARAYLLKRSPSAALLAWHAGIPHRVGHATGLGRALLTRAVRWRRDRHYADGLLDLLRIDGVPVDDGQIAHWGPAAAASARVASILARLPARRPRVFVAVRATDGRRQWPLDRWVDVLRRLVKEQGCEVVFCGGPDDAAALAAITADLGTAAVHAHDLSEAVPLEDVAALLGRMDLYLGVNSGLMHLAAACGTPTVAVFDAADAVRWRPRGAPHAIVCGRARHRGLAGWFARGVPGQAAGRFATGAAVRAVGVREVVAQAVGLLAARRPPASLPTLDLRTGRRRYEVTVRPATVPDPLPAAG